MEREGDLIPRALVIVIVIVHFRFFSGSGQTNFIWINGGNLAFGQDLNGAPVTV